MLNKVVFWLSFLTFGTIWAQDETGLTYQKIAVTNDTITFSSKSVVNAFFSVRDVNDTEIDTSYFWVSPELGKIYFRERNRIMPDTVTIRYLNYPEFLTQTYTLNDESKIVDTPVSLQVLRGENREQRSLIPFDGLSSTGSISRGITVGNNQNAVVDSNLDIQLSGEISSGIQLRASIQDDNIPIQDGGYSQRLNEFDQVFMELYAKKWKLRGGDVILENRDLTFMNFSKKVQGIATAIEMGKEETKTTLYNSIGVVRGQYARSNFVGQEGNQGPYKLRGNNGELYVLIISGSERVFVNGILLQRGETEAYMIDYGAGEIRFNATYPITSEMRIAVEYQYTERSYNRFVTYNRLKHEQDKWYAGGYAYIESDIRNQPLQQSLSDEQKIILSQAGDDRDKMVAPSAVEDTYLEGKILYNKILVGGEEIYELAIDDSQKVYQVRFSFVGNNQGDYKVVDPFALDKVYQYVSPVNGVKQGGYVPNVAVVAPMRLGVYVVEAGYNNEDKTMVSSEVGISQRDENLFSTIDDENNQGVAGKLCVTQQLFSKKWKGKVYGEYQFIDENFNSVERVQEIEFSRNWNILNPIGDQQLVTGGLEVELPQKGAIKYQVDQLSYSNYFEGIKHQLNSRFDLNRWNLSSANSVLASQQSQWDTHFYRSSTQLKHNYKRNWIGGSLRHEDQQQKDVMTRQFDVSSQRFTEWGTFIGRGDSTKVYAQIGYLERKNDSIQSGVLQRVNRSHSYYLRSQLLQDEINNLSLFVNYRQLKYTDATVKDEPSLNSRVNYSGAYWKGFVQTSVLYENTSGTIAQQDFTYIEVEPGQGVYTWIDYNVNGVKELSEFEVAQFKDQAKYVRLFLPNQVFVKTHQNKLSNSWTINPTAWKDKKGIQKVLSHFFNQASFQIERKVRRNGDFVFDPFASSGADDLGLNKTIRNSLFYNRGMQKHSLMYQIVQSNTQYLLATGGQQNLNHLHQLQYTHLIQKTVLLGLDVKRNKTANYAENFTNRNYELIQYKAEPKIGLVLPRNNSVSLHYSLTQKKNRILGAEFLEQHQLGMESNYQAKKGMNLRAQVSYFKNNFTGNSNTSVAYQMLEGLLPGVNYTWLLTVTKSITSYLDLNLNYQGRQAQESRTIHTGSLQLRAFF